MEYFQHGQASLKNYFLHIYQNKRELSLYDWIKHKRNTISTKTEHIALEMEKYISPKRQGNTNGIFATIGMANPDTEKVYRYLPGQFPVTSDK